MSIRFDEALENDILSPALLKSISSECKCGAQMILSDSLRYARCSRNNCIYTTINRVKSINNKLKLGISDTEVENIVKKLKISTPYQIFMLDSAAKSNIITEADIKNLNNVLDSLKTIKQNKYYIYEVVGMSGIDSIDSTAKALFIGFDSISEAYSEIDKGQISFISDRLGLTTTESSSLGVEIYNRLVGCIEEFLFAEMQLNIKKYSDFKINIAFSDGVFPFVNKREYIDYINSLTKYKFNFVHSISSDTDVLVRSSSEGGSKSRAAKIINDKFVADAVNKGELNLSDIGIIRYGELKPIGSSIYICSSDELISRLKKLEVE